MSVASPLKWHGGKSPLAKKIRDLLPSHARYCEPFFGGGSVLLAGDGDNVAEFANDIYGELTNFWRVLRHPREFELFCRYVEAIPFSEESFLAAEQDLMFLGSLTPTMEQSVQRAVAFFVHNRQSRQGLGKDYANPTIRLRRRMNENVSAWLTAVDGLTEVHARLRRVEIWNRPAVEFIRKLDSPETLFYCDPPYVHETRSSTGEYQHEMGAADHAVLLDTLADIKGKFILSGYACPLYDTMAARCGWHRVVIEVPNHASSKREKERKQECLWMNFVPESA